MLSFITALARNTRVFAAEIMRLDAPESPLSSTAVAESLEDYSSYEH